MRLWALYGLGQQVVGAVVPRHLAPPAVAAHAEPWWAVVSHAGLGDAKPRETLDGRRFVVYETPGPYAQQWSGFSTDAAALEYLEHVKEKNLAAGWIEAPLDPIGDPD